MSVYRSTEGRLTEPDLVALTTAVIPLLRVRSFVDQALCRELVQRIQESPWFGRGDAPDRVQRFGRPYAEARYDRPLLAEYLATQAEWVQALRDMAVPYVSPFDRLRLELDDCWPAGAHRASVEHHKLYAGLIRSFPVGAHALPHADFPVVPGFTHQLAGNLFLAAPVSGGVLQLWLVHADCDTARDAPAILRGRSPDIEIAPEVGDLILFPSSLLHAVTPVHEGHRMAWSAFIGFSGLDKPLVIWS